ncbi:MAG: MutH/Sau3AI family endonuclease, partial [Erysipelotrichaceae bacterium]|nr:MutH/Sau3AI family endonuclease [Erysipelotrichaceae bacterium]
SAIFKLEKDISQTQEFQKANIKVKTVRLEKNGKINEHMSFKSFDFIDLVNQEWEESDFYKDIAQTKFLFVIFQKIDELDENSYLKDIKLWQMPEDDVLIAQKCWEKTKKIIKKGIRFELTSKGVINNLPKVYENYIAHVRPHASKAAYLINGKKIGDLKNANILPNGDWMTKQCFWLNRDYILSVID